ncbi:LacI family DNA-binding transcriptional regulator [Bifidobacterium bombi]|uniref:Transcriptional regulator, LacI family n=1 Tax=Bifidobacterium bombi DSM 19703 TaxID=1341695 RepID=A0A080N6H3_9BIFI|nr:LacI family DNA-binding transcriptional regulator [Bifidobacterium bombi]KFF31619.1 transcriptional regulator, LacI family [Bifidobacterium bombi DSM 19703]
MNGENNVSIIEVAALADVSTATVSRVLSGKRTKNDDISRRVRKAAQSLNYEANYAASALRSDVTKSYGLLIETVQDTFTAQMVDALEQAANTADRQLILAIGMNRETREERLATLYSRRIDGLIAVARGKGARTGGDESTNGPDDQGIQGHRIADFAASHPDFSVVQISGNAPTLYANWVGMDDSGTIQLAIDHLTARNATSIAFLGDFPNNMLTANMFATFQSTSEITSMYTEPEWSTFGPHTVERGYRDTLGIFSPQSGSGRRPQGLICTSLHVAIGARMALGQLGLSVPEDVKIICITDNRPFTNEELEFTTVSPAYEYMAEETIRLLESRKKSPHWLPAHTMFPPHIVQRASTHAPRFGASDMEQPASRDQ